MTDYDWLSDERRALAERVTELEEERDAGLVWLDEIAETLGLVDHEPHGGGRIYGSPAACVERIKSLLAETAHYTGELPKTQTQTNNDDRLAATQAALSEAISRCGDEDVYYDLHRRFGHLLARPTNGRHA